MTDIRTCRKYEQAGCGNMLGKRTCQVFDLEVNLLILLHSNPLNSLRKYGHSMPQNIQFPTMFRNQHKSRIDKSNNLTSANMLLSLVLFRESPPEYA